MISLIKTVLRIIFLSVFVYIALFSIYKVKDDQLGIVREIHSGQVLYSFSNDINFIRHGLLPWVYRVETVPSSGSVIIEVSIPLISSELSDENVMSVKIPLEVSYTINSEAPPEPDFFSSEIQRKEFFIKRASIICRTVLKNYIEPVYNRNGINRNESLIMESILSGVKESLNGSGVIVDSINGAGSISLPSAELYRENLLRDAEIRAISFENKKQEMLLKNKLAKERIATDIYYENLSRMGGIIKENPEILKYIYIDKLAGNIKVIVSSEKSGIPVIFGQDQIIKESDLKKEIDNLR